MEGGRAVTLDSTAYALAELAVAKGDAPEVRYGTVESAGDEVTVLLDGAEDASPAACAMAVHEGDRVTLEVRGRRVVVTGNITSPATDDAAANAAQRSADEAAASAESALGSAADALEAAVQAKASAESAVSDAADAKSAAQSAVQDASDAKSSAQAANTAANGAVTGLATVQGVVDALGRDVDDMQAHVAMMDAYSDGHGGTVPAGLHVVPSEGGYFLVLSNDGTYVYDPDSNLVATFGENVLFSADRPQRIGGEDAYVEYYDSDSDGVADSIRIVADSVSLTSGGSVEQAVADARAALDSATLTVTSTNGQLFKNSQESTVLQVAVFPNGGGRLDTIEQVRARFGAGAYIEWRWKRDDGSWGTMVSSDPHISMGGMWLTVTPADVATKTSFEASLVTP